MSALSPAPRHPDAERYLAAVERAAHALLAGDSTGAHDAVGLIAGELWQGMPSWSRPAVRSGPASVDTPRASFTPGRAAATFMRDHFCCRYCGQRIVPVCVLSVLSSVYPRELPYVSTYKRGAIHAMYWLIGAEADHLEPGARGGNWTDPANHATACVLCNTRKSDWTLAELGWETVPPQTPSWDGLTPLYRSLWETAGHPDPRYHRRWLDAFEGATDGGVRPAAG